ncbi:hypothetical protein QTP86_000860 [Hemibagrus guttatus]|nr:hypothetical protein QTP86_000860 [Hemibagrus guttatus]
MLFIFSSAFNTVVPSKLIAKLSDLGICISLCSWNPDFLTNGPRSVRLGNRISSTLILNTGIPQGCVLSPLLYSLFTHDCVSRHNSNIIKYADDTTVVGQISNNDESAYGGEIQCLSAWRSMNNRTLNAMKTKELIVDFRKSNSSRHSSIYINGSEVERVSGFKFLGIHISEDPSLASEHLNSAQISKCMDTEDSGVHAYNRKTLLQYSNHATTNLHDDLLKKLCNLGLLRRPGLQSSASPDVGGWERGHRKRCSRKRKHGKRAGVRARLKTNPSRPALPSIILSNVCSLYNKLDYIRLQRTTRREYRDC